MAYHVTEPHPSVRKNKTTYIQAGRGGAGNMARYQASSLTNGTTAVGPASRTLLIPPPTTSIFTSGRGGAGNTFRHRSESPRRIFSFDEELAREQRIMDNAAKAPVYRIGRGGAGNMVTDASDERRMSAGSDLSRTISNESNATAGSRGSTAARLSGAFARLGRTLSGN